MPSPTRGGVFRRGVLENAREIWVLAIGMYPGQGWGTAWVQADGSNVQVGAGSLRLNVGRSDHLGPFLGFVRDEFAEIGRRESKHIAAEIG